MKKLLKYLTVCLSFILLAACSKTEKSQINDKFSYTEDGIQNIEVDQTKIKADDNETAKKEDQIKVYDEKNLQANKESETEEEFHPNIDRLPHQNNILHK